MDTFREIPVTSLLLSSSLVIIAIFFSYYQKLKLEKDIVISIVRAVIQLFIVGYLLNFIFSYKSPIFTSILLLIMIVNASWNAAKRGKGIEDGFKISFLAILIGSSITMGLLLLTGALKFEAYQMVPVGGMIIGNSMVALGLSYKNLVTNFRRRREEVETKLSLGGGPKESSMDIIRDAIKTGMQPTIDSARTLGIVTLPGMMTGLILAGTNPVEAIKYQIMVTFMLLSTTSIASFISCYFAYKGFFNDRMQVKRIKAEV